MQDGYASKVAPKTRMMDIQDCLSRIKSKSEEIDCAIIKLADSLIGDNSPAEEPVKDCEGCGSGQIGDILRELDNHYSNLEEILEKVYRINNEIV